MIPGDWQALAFQLTIQNRSYFVVRRYHALWYGGVTADGARAGSGKREPPGNPLKTRVAA